jgi:pimeloyl-ACP methyl ester carboxylesterase
MSVKLASRPARTRLIIMAAVLALAGLLATAGQAGSARAATARTGHAAAVTGTGPAKPTIVLVHGAWADSGSWNAVTGLLQRAGYTVYAPPNPLEGLAIDTATLADFLHSSLITGPIVLVGHSYGGEVITNAATGDSQVKALVYDDAYLPKQGEDLVDLTKPGSCFAVQDLSTVFKFVHDPVSPSGAVAYVKPTVFPGCFANGLPPSAGAVLAATQRPLATSTFTDQSGVPAWQTIPSWDIVGTADHIITPAEQLFMANRAHAHITEINAPHLSMITDPGVVASVIIQAARATS